MESGYAYPERSEDNPAAVWENAKAETDVRAKENIMVLSEVSRGHSKPDDCSIYVKREKYAQRVMETITKYIEDKLKLKVNCLKSKVSRPTESMLLAFPVHRIYQRLLLENGTQITLF